MHHISLPQSYEIFKRYKNNILVELKTLIIGNRTNIKLQELIINEDNKLSIKISYISNGENNLYKMLIPLEQNRINIRIVENFVTFINNAMTDEINTVSFVVTTVSSVLDLIEHKYLIKLNNY